MAELEKDRQKSLRQEMDHDDEAKAKVICFIGFLALIYGIVAIIYNARALSGKNEGEWLWFMNINTGLTVVIIGSLLWIIAALISLRLTVRSIGH